MNRDTLIRLVACLLEKILSNQIKLQQNNLQQVMYNILYRQKYRLTAITDNNLCYAPRSCTDQLRLPDRHLHKLLVWTQRAMSLQFTPKSAVKVNSAPGVIYLLFYLSPLILPS